MSLLNRKCRWALVAAAALCAAMASADTPPDSVFLQSASGRVTQENMNREQVTNPLEAINGRVAGLTITKANNGVAAMNAVRVRGTTSLTGGNDPLIIVDGVMGDLNTLSSIYPADIESFDVLKDATETAQYGARGASGVIVVTTKKGGGDKARISYNGSYGFSSVFKNLNMLDANGYRQSVTERGLMLIDHGHNTNWQKQIEHTGWRHDHNVAFSGGGKQNGYRVSLGYIDHQGVILHEHLRNFTSNMSLHQSMFNNLLDIELGLFGNVRKDQTAIFDTQKVFYSAAAFNPTFAPTGDINTGYEGFTYANQISHPLALMDSRTNNKNTHLSTHAKFTFNISKHWKIGLFGSYSHNEVERSQFLPTHIWAKGQAFRGTNKTESLLGNIMASYNTSLGRHTLSALALAEAQQETLTGFCTTTTNFTNNQLGYHSIQAGALTLWEGTSSYRYAPTQAAFMGRFTWNYDDRFSITATARADGSSKFGDNHKWGFFPSISGAWTLSHEQWLKNVAWLSNLKLRAGVGLAGNQGAIDSYLTSSMLQPTGVVPAGNDMKVALGNPRNTNPDLKWEVKRTINAGIDVAFLNNRIIAGIDFYTSKTRDMLYNYNVPVPPFAYTKLLANLGSMRNSGVELSLGIAAVQTRDMELNINANITRQSNKLLSLSGYYHGYFLDASDYVDIAGLNGAGFHGGNNNIVYQVVGQPLGVFYLPHCTGLKKNDNGDYEYEIADLNNDGVVITDNGQDRRICGQATPKVLLGSNISFRYKHWDIALQINGAFGHKIYNGTSLTYMNMSSLPGYNVLAKAPAARINDQTATDYWLERGDYVNLDYITLGYNVPLASHKVVKSLRLSLTVSNLATITSYSGLTPIINSSNVDKTLGVDDKRSYPLSRTCTLDVSISF